MSEHTNPTAEPKRGAVLTDPLPLFLFGLIVAGLIVGRLGINADSFLSSGLRLQDGTDLRD
jgi:hypothetical protein